MPPGLSLPTPRDEVEEPVPKAALTSKARRHREKDPAPRITKDEYVSVGRSLDIWGRLENPGGNPEVTDDIFFEEKAMAYAKQGRLFCLEDRRAQNFTYANRASRVAWKQKVHFGEAPEGYTHEDEFFDLLVRRRQPQYDATVKEAKRRNDE